MLLSPLIGGGKTDELSSVPMRVRVVGSGGQEEEVVDVSAGECDKRLTLLFLGNIYIDPSKMFYMHSIPYPTSL
ncbi:hypothetical protein EON65_51595 [archaeon]|nr:MAG: hypothetical protein EON65_51595 [archaeon]